MITWLTELKEGDTAFLRSARRNAGGNREVTVMKVGRKWLYVNGGSKFDRNQDVSCGYAREEHTYGSPDLLYSSQNDYEQSLRMLALARNIVEHIQRKRLSDEQLTQIALIIGDISDE